MFTISANPTPNGILDVIRLLNGSPTPNEMKLAEELAGAPAGQGRTTPAHPTRSAGHDPARDAPGFHLWTFKRT
jgi:hypothetical protein